MPGYPAPRYTDFDSDSALTAAQYMLSPDIPPEERMHFEKFYLMFSKIMALGNIEREDVFGLILAFEEICILLEMGLYDEARQMMGKELMKVQCSRSIGGFYTLYGQQGVQRTEQIDKIYQRRQRNSLTQRLAGIFGGGGKQSRGQESWERVR
jgi:hypothetical protein